MSHAEDVGLWYRYAFNDPETAAAMDAMSAEIYDRIMPRIADEMEHRAERDGMEHDGWTEEHINEAGFDVPWFR